jgi:hypothetical protein
MICPVTNDFCQTNGCGDKCYKLHTLDSGHKVNPKYDSQREGFKELKIVPTNSIENSTTITGVKIKS